MPPSPSPHKLRTSSSSRRIKGLPTGIYFGGIIIIVVVVIEISGFIAINLVFQYPKGDKKCSVKPGTFSTAAEPKVLQTELNRGLLQRVRRGKKSSHSWWEGAVNDIGCCAYLHCVKTFILQINVSLCGEQNCKASDSELAAWLCRDPPGTLEVWNVKLEQTRDKPFWKADKVGLESSSAFCRSAGYPRDRKCWILKCLWGKGRTRRKKPMEQLQSSGIEGLMRCNSPTRFTKALSELPCWCGCTDGCCPLS